MADIRAADEDGNVRSLDGGAGDQMVNDIYLRGEFPPPGKARAPRPGAKPLDRYHNCVSALGTAMDAVDRAPISARWLAMMVGRWSMRGVEQRTCAAWRQLLERIDDEIVVWARTYQRTMGVVTSSQTRSAEDGEQSELFDDEAQAHPIEQWDADTDEQVPAQ
ncbi:hypothetical protein [Bradyrhizobium sp. JR4.1]|uniref:hypothetical protein n=1 Tax=Bradyrhizobium sp. JR4.1 TaxID=3156372 RepID=UPI003394EAC1